MDKTCIYHIFFVPLHHQNNKVINQLKRKGFNYDKENIVPEEVAETK